MVTKIEVVIVTIHVVKVTVAKVVVAAIIFVVEGVAMADAVTIVRIMRFRV